MEDERVTEGPVVAVKRSNVRGAKRPYTYEQTLPAILTFRLRRGGGPYIPKALRLSRRFTESLGHHLPESWLHGQGG